MNRNVLAAIAATIAVLGVIILGFVVMGSPGSQRLVQADNRRVQRLAQLAQQINNSWNHSDNVLPSNLEKFADTFKNDPVTGTSFVYKPKAESKYELCATFARDNRDDPGINTGDPWIHPGGEYCFFLDATRPVPNVPYYY